jgi:hypothetical protein
VSDEFEGAIEEAKRLEKKQMEYAPFQGEISIERTLDLEPRDYVDLGYPDMINLYERSQKIISTTGLGILATSGKEAAGAAKAEPVQKVETGEVETRLLQMTAETLKTAEAVGKEPIALEKPPEPGEAAKSEEPAPKPAAAVEFETRTAQEGIEIERESSKPPQAPETGIEMEKEREMAPVAPKAPEMPKPRAVPEIGVEVPIEKRVIVAAVPPALREPDKAASKRYEQMEEQIRAAVGEKADEMTLKKKMLDLTKQLFKEKITSKREEIKLQITVLKNMLAGLQAGGGAARPAAGAKKVGAQAEAHMKLLDAIVSAQQGELAQTKDSIIDSYNKQVVEIKKKFYDQISMTEDTSARKKTFESFVFSVESLVEQLPEVLRKYREFTGKKHAAELEKILGSLAADEKETRVRVEERIDYVNNKYDQEFTAVKGIIGRQIENLIEVAGTEIFKKAEETPKEAEAKAYDTVKEVNETDEGTLLYFLHTKDPDYYKRYERKQLSKAEAIFKAKELMAKDKGLSDSMVKKYFSQTEG